MPSGAKKRKAAKKKKQQDAHKNGAHPSQGNDDPKTLDERESDGDEVERESSEGAVVKDNGEGGKEVSLEGENVAQSEGVNLEENSRDVTVDADDATKGARDGEDKSSSSSRSSSSSSSDDDEVAVENEKPVEGGSGEVQQQSENPIPEMVASEEHTLEESIPIEESVKQVVSLSDESISASETTLHKAVESAEVEPQRAQNVDEVLPPSVENDKVSSVVETKVISVDEGSGNSAEPVDIKAREDECLLPQSSDVTTVDKCCGDDKHKNSEEEKPLVPSAQPLVQRTSWLSCCGLFDVVSGGSSR